jgi:menaquinone-dependent protoporphyrinogen IX oxidase
MKAVVVYDSQYGNTEKIARAIAEALSAQAGTTVCHAAAFAPEALVGCDLLVIGSPTQAFHATKPMEGLLKGHRLDGIRAAAFDTRIDMARADSRVFKMAVKVAGDNAWAATRIADQLEKDGATLVGPPAGFYVQDTEGPLAPGELERASAWATGLLAAI